MKKNLFVIFIGAFLTLFLFGCFQKVKYDIAISPKEYKIDNKLKNNSYVKFLKENIKPEKLVQYIDFDNIYIDDIYMNDSCDLIEYLRFEGYSAMLTNIFSDKVINFNNFPLTGKFKNKFSKGVKKYFNLYGECTCDINSELNSFTIIESGFNEGESEEWTLFHHFKCDIDSEGNVDDIIFDYTE